MNGDTLIELSSPQGTSSDPMALPLAPKQSSNSSLNGSGGEQPEADEWGEFLHLPGKKFYDFNEIREEIVRDTDIKCGKNTGVSGKLKIMLNNSKSSTYQLENFLSKRPHAYPR